MFLSLLAEGEPQKTFWDDVTNYFANFDGATNTCRTIFLYVSIALVLAFIVCKFTVKRDKQPLVNKIALFVAIGYAAAVIITFAVLAFVDDDIVAITFFPLLCFIVVCIVGGLLIAVKPNKIVKISSASVMGAALLAVIVCMVVYYTVGDAADHNWISKDDVSDVGLYVSAALLTVGIVVLGLLADRKSKPFDSRTIAFAAVCIALSFALSYIRIFKMPMGGSITLASTLPLMLFSFMFGSRKGLLAGLIYGALQAVQDPWILHPAQFVLDYAVAFMGIGVAGFIKDFNILKGNSRAQFAIGAVIAGLLRFVAHYFSGVFAFGSAGAGYAEEYGIAALASPWVYSLVYQALYVIPDLLIVVVAGVILFSSKSFTRQLEKYTVQKTANDRSTAQDLQPSTVPESGYEADTFKDGGETKE